MTKHPICPYCRLADMVERLSRFVKYFCSRCGKEFEVKL